MGFRKFVGTFAGALALPTLNADFAQLVLIAVLGIFLLYKVNSRGFRIYGGGMLYAYIIMFLTLSANSLITGWLMIFLTLDGRENLILGLWIWSLTAYTLLVVVGKKGGNKND